MKAWNACRFSNPPGLAAVIARLALLAVLLGLSARPSLAQQAQRITDASRKYDVMIRVSQCDEPEYESGPSLCRGEVSVFRKGALTAFQIPRLPELWLNLDQVTSGPRLKRKPSGIYDREYTLVFDDFNFDGREDLAICNGTNGGYGGPSYTIYLYDRGQQRIYRKN